jgi:membrane protease YdiL (CAAX protease family)
MGTFYSLVHSGLEEYYWRWFVFGQLSRRVPLAAAIAISSLGFMAHHVLVLSQFFHGYGAATWFFSLCVAVGGAVWAWLYQRSGSLYGPWVSHMIIDAGLMVIGYQLWTQS